MITSPNKTEEEIIADISAFGKKLKKFSNINKIPIEDNEKKDYEKAFKVFLEWFNSLEEEFIYEAGCHFLCKILPTAPINVKKHFYGDNISRLEWLDKISEEYFKDDISFDYYLDESGFIEIKFTWKKF